MAYQSLLMPQASSLPARGLAWLRGAHGLCAALAVAIALVQGVAFASRGTAGGQSANQRLEHYVPWIEKTLQLPQPGARVGEFARYYTWSRSYPGDVHVALVRDPSQTGVHIKDADNVIRPAEGECDSISARVDVVKRRIVAVSCNSSA